ncbi:MAG: cell envelope integrity protein TolA [Desulfovermiculus sp.]|nr:cell envelope integrity protein TolA [Desulfovermiculus sp.]
MGFASCLFALLLHIGLVFITMYAPWHGGAISLDLDKPVYEVELVRMPEQKKAVQVPRTSEQEPGRKQASQQAKALPRQQPKAKPAPPKPVQIAKQDEKKPQASKVTQKKKSEPQESPKPQSREDVKTPESELEDAIQEVTAQAEQEAQTDAEVLAQELAQLSKEQAAQGIDLENLGRSSAREMTERLYGNLIRGRIRTNWRFPDLGGDEDLHATVQIQINEQGEIVDHSLERSSGNPQFDNSVLRAIARTGSLQAPPNPDLKSIRIEFHLQDLTP